MSFRTVLITQNSKLSYKDDYLVVRNESINLVHLSEINTLIIDNTMVSITSYLIAELLKKKIKVVFCDMDKNPVGELIPYYGSHNTSKRIFNQISWDQSIKTYIWTQIVKHKILNQANFLFEIKRDKESVILKKYYEEIQDDDLTNREGHAAKVYFNCLFGKNFNRNEKNDINAALDYGYIIILSNFNREITAKGHLTQLGLKHKNEFNFFNFSCDLMEPFRIFIDRLIYLNKEKTFDKDYKNEIINILNKRVIYNCKQYFLSNCIQIYVNNIIEALDNGVMPIDNIFKIYEL